MSDAPISLFLNPAAGRGRCARLRPAVIRQFEENGIACRLEESQGAGELERLVTEAIRGGARRLLVGGGDGSVHEAVNAILATGEDVELGVIPLGSGNDFAKACSIAPHWEDALTLLIDRLRNDMPSRPVDIGRMNGRYFVNSAGIGLEAEVSALARRIRLPLGDLVYLLAAIRTLAGTPGATAFSILTDEESMDEAAMMISLCNGPWIGGMFEVAPRALNDDGELDLVVAGRANRLRLLRLLPKLIAGTHLDQPEVTFRRVRSCRIEAGEDVLSHLDGEVQAPARQFRVEVLPGALSLL